MKKILVFSWTAILLIVLFFVIRSLPQKEVLKTLYQEQDISRISFTPEAFHNLNAFKSFLAYLNHDLQSMHHYAQKSLDYQSYFFNNYLQYVYYRDMLHADSAEIYKTRALQSLEGADIFVYETLVREMDPHHPMLDWISEAVHVHDAHCRHKSPDPQS